MQNAADFLSENASDIPIFRVASSDVEHGVLGGISYSYYDAGRIAGEVSARILNGESADDIPLITSSVTAPYFEQKAMDRFGIRYAQLPAGVTVINEHENLARFYRENTTMSNLILIIVLLMVVIILLLNYSNNRRKKVIRTDFLTQMPNRLKIMEDMTQAIKEATPYGVIMMDVDHFKDINDTYGHKSGDEIIAGVGERLKKLSCKELTFARLGGDEFCGFFTSPTKEKAEKICRDIMDCTKEEFETSRGKLKLTVSIGCAMYPLDTDKKDLVMECADKALYITKEKGRDGYTLFGSIDETA
jgi:diguanylate cyclase (GGDEF)-like protein